MTAIVKTFQISTGDTPALNAARMVAALDSLAPDANDHVFLVHKGDMVLVAKVPV